MANRKNPKKGAFGRALIAILAVALVCAFAALGQNTPAGNESAAESDEGVLFMLLQIQADLQGSLNDLDLDVASAAQNLSAIGLEGTASHGIITQLLEADPNIIEASTFSKDGKIIIAEGKVSKGIEGTDISNQEHIARVLNTKTPVVSKQFQLMEGYNGTVLAYPVFSPQGEFIGGVGAIVDPYKLMDAIVTSELMNSQSNADIAFWLLLPDGLIAYDKHPSEIGGNLFEDPLYKPYPSLLELGQKMIAERSGDGYYSFPATEGNNTVVKKETYWTTIGLHGMEWRLAATTIV